MYEMKNRVTYSQVGSNLKADMAAIAHYFQDCTIFHSESMGKGLVEVAKSHRAWFLSSWQIEVKRYPEFMEEITVRTWPHAFKSMYGYRNFDILDREGNRIVQANSIWIFMDLEKQRPVKPSQEDIEGYDMETPLDMEYAPRKIQVFEAEYQLQDVDTSPITVKQSFLDSNHHVNNGCYVAEAMNYLQAGVDIRQLRVDYRKAATLGDKMYPSVFEKEDVWQVIFSDEAGNPFAIIEVVCYTE